MALEPAICTQCGKILRVENTWKSAKCVYCGTTFSVDKAVKNYHASKREVKEPTYSTSSNQIIVTKKSINTANSTINTNSINNHTEVGINSGNSTGYTKKKLEQIRKKKAEQSLVPAICTQCGARIEVDNTKDVAICKRCGEAFIVERAIKKYNIYATNTGHTNSATIQNGNMNDCFKIETNVLTQYTGYDEIVNIPEGVVKVGDSAFEANKYIKYVNLPSSCRGIGKRSFENCSNLEEVIGIERILEIGGSAFGGCRNLKNINKLENISIIGHGAFSGCGRLTGTLVAKNITSIEDEAFCGTGYSTIDFTNVLLEDLRLVRNMTGTFRDMRNLKTLKISSAIWECHKDRSLFQRYEYDSYGCGSPEEGSRCPSLEEIYIDGVRHDYQSPIVYDFRVKGSALFEKSREYQRKIRKEKGQCIYCGCSSFKRGSSIKTYFKEYCSKCGMEKKH